MPVRLKHIVVGYPRRPFIDTLAANSARYGADFTHLPRYWGAGSFGVVNKITVLKAYLESGSLDMDDVVLFTDAYDTLLVEHASQILGKFYRFGADLVVSGEANFWPDEGREAVKEQFKVYDGKWRYLNSGGYIGYAWAIKQMVDYCADKLSRGDLGYHKPDDQVLIQQFFLDHRCDPMYRIRLDFNADIFASINTTVGDFVVERGAVAHKWTGRNTSVLHANGHKPNMEILHRYWSLVGGDTSHPRDWDLRVAATPDGFLCYDAERKKLVVADRPDCRTMVFLVKGARQAIALLPTFGLATFTREREVHHSATRIVTWELLAVRPEVTSYHSIPLREYVAPDVIASPVQLVGLPLEFFLEPALDAALNLAQRYEHDF